MDISQQNIWNRKQLIREHSYIERVQNFSCGTKSPLSLILQIRQRLWFLDTLSRSCSYFLLTPNKFNILNTVFFLIFQCFCLKKKKNDLKLELFIQPLLGVQAPKSRSKNTTPSKTKIMKAVQRLSLSLHLSFFLTHTHTHTLSLQSCCGQTIC